jgi:hypothetical protein
MNIKNECKNIARMTELLDTIMERADQKAWWLEKVHNMTE